MNKAILIGRLTRDPELRTTTSDIPVCSFTIAVDRRYKGSDGERQADFIPVIAWRKSAEFVNKYFKKGDKISVVGSIQTRTYEDRNGTKKYVTEVIAEELGFVENRARQEESGSYDNGYDGLPDI